MIQEILRLDVKEIKKLQKETRSFLEALYENGIVQEKSIIKYNSPYDEKIKKLPELRKQVVETFVTPNYIYDEEKTKRSLQEKVSQIYRNQSRNISRKKR
jgi:membrane-associated HD superfamily phosphohydrolase